MSKRTVTNGNGRTVVTEATKDFAVATAPDVLLDPKKKRKQFNNWIEVEEGKLHGGTSPATTIAGKSIWILQALVGPPSFHTPPPAKTPHGPGFIGTTNGAPADGPAEAVSGSTNLKAEGEPVVRVKDPTWQNDRNTTGEVMTEVKLLALQEDGGDETGGGARARGAGGRGGAPGSGQTQAGGALLPPSGTTPVEQCSVLEVAAACKHGRRAQGLLQVVTTSEDEIRLEGRVDGPCGREHPVWVVEGGAPPAGLRSSFKAQAPAKKPISFGPNGFETLGERDRNTYRIRCKGCKDNNHLIVVEAYEPGTRRITLDRGRLAHILIVLSATLEFFGAEQSDLAPSIDPARPIVDALAGAVVGTVEVLEHPPNHKAYVAMSVALSFNPFLQVGFKLDLVGIVTDMIIARLTGMKLKLKGKQGAVGMVAGRPMIKRLRKWVTDQVEKGKEKIDNLKDRLLDLQGEISERLGGNEEDQQRARDMLREHLDRMGNLALAACPFALPKTELQGDISVYLALDALIKTPGPDVPDPVITGSAVTGSVKLKVAASAKSRFELPLLGVPTDCSIEFDGGVAIKRLMYATRSEFGMLEGTDEFDGRLKVHVKLAAVEFLDIPEGTVKVKVTLPRTQLYPKIKLMAAP